MTETPDPVVTGPVLSAAEAKKRFLIYVAVKFAGLGLLIGGLFLARSGLDIVSGALLLLGAASFFLKPKMLGLTTRPER
jgi:hypothetical protein